ncbi:hypothetical protein ACJJTC_018651 [Scirpophaga incertulas]
MFQCFKKSDLCTALRSAKAAHGLASPYLCQSDSATRDIYARIRFIARSPTNRNFCLSWRRIELPNKRPTCEKDLNIDKSVSRKMLITLIIIASASAKLQRNRIVMAEQTKHNQQHDKFYISTSKTAAITSDTSCLKIDM